MNTCSNVVMLTPYEPMHNSPLWLFKSANSRPNIGAAVIGRATTISPAIDETIRASGTERWITSRTAIAMSHFSKISFLEIVNTYPAPNLVLRKRDVPEHRKCPSDIIAILSPRMSASSMKCVVRTITRPSFFFCSSSHVDRLEYGSIPLVGSSKSTNLGSPTRAIANDSFLFIPPDSALDGT
mmetsp:Transcript_200/g.365  ORF Transcript_200/g.365 Transcript_200/m.365 type:complete len:183 (+) Transcript_200:3598-4146(+)